MSSSKLDVASSVFMIGAGLSKTGTTSLIATLKEWGIAAAHWGEGHHLFRLTELERDPGMYSNTLDKNIEYFNLAPTQSIEAIEHFENAEGESGAVAGSGVSSTLTRRTLRKKTQDQRSKSPHIRVLSSVLGKLEALADLPVPALLVELMLARPQWVVVLTERRNLTSWSKSYKSWLTKSCRSKIFQGCPSKPAITLSRPLSSSGSATYNPSDAPRFLIAEACPANILTFGHTCPSSVQALKRLLLNELMVRVIVSPDFLVKTDVTSAKTTQPTCLDLQKAVLRRSRGTSRVSWINSSTESLALKPQSVNRRSPRNPQSLALSLLCHAGLPFVSENVNTQLHPELASKLRDKRRKEKGAKVRGVKRREKNLAP